MVMKDQILKLKDRLTEYIRNHKELAAICLILAGVVSFIMFNDFQSREEYYNVTMKTVEEEVSVTDKESSEIYHESSETVTDTLNTEVSVDVAEETDTEPEALVSSENTEETSGEETTIAAGETEQMSESESRSETDSPEVLPPPVPETTEIVPATEEPWQEPVCP